MEVDCIHYKDTGYFSPIVLDYLKESDKLKPFYSHSPALSSFGRIIEQKKFVQEKREVLVNALKAQYQRAKIKLVVDQETFKNIELLADENTFTVTTGHQLNLFTGPLYFIYKIVSAINLAKQLKKEYPANQFVPVYWMATEDHDFEEISFFRFQGKKLKWDTKQQGAVGRMNPQELSELFADFSKLLLPYTSHGNQLKKWFEEAYLKRDTLADAMLYLVHELFSEHGLVIVDGDEASLKAQMHSYFEEELLHEVSSQKVDHQSKELAKNYKVQANPRAINLFYLRENSRNRIEYLSERFHIVDSELSFSKEEMLDELKNHPERFSPNVLLRPLYQEVILPNLAYIGGGGELAYWFQLNSTFEHFKVPFPMLLLRNSVLWMDEKQSKYASELGISNEELFHAEGVLLKNWVKKNSKLDLELKQELADFEKLYKDLKQKSKIIDESLAPHVSALAEKQKQSIQQLSEKLIRAERKKNDSAADRIQTLKEELFPNASLQERTNNFSEFYLAYGNQFIASLLENLQLPTNQFSVIKNWT